MSKHNELIKDLKAKKWLYKGKPVSVISHQKTHDEYVFCLNDGEVVHCFEQNLEATLLEKFIPLPAHSKVSNTPVKVGVFSDTLAQLRDVLLDNISKVQKDKDFVPQAREINNSVKEVCNLAKIDIEYIKLSNKL